MNIGWINLYEDEFYRNKQYEKENYGGDPNIQVK